MINVESSARHIHVSKEDLDILFGKDYKLTKKKDLSQPGQFLCEEKVTVIGEKNETKLSILGPIRKQTQVEVAYTDTIKLGIKAPLRESGDLRDAGTCKIIGPNGTIEKRECVIIAKRHIHMTDDDAKKYNVTNGEIVKVSVDSPERKVIFDDVIVRVSDTYSLAFHLDTDESNACYGAKFATIIK